MHTYKIVLLIFLPPICAALSIFAPIEVRELRIIAVNAAIFALPQIIWWAIWTWLSKKDPRRLVGGILGAHLILGWLWFSIMRDSRPNSGMGWMLYFPACLLFVPIGSLCAVLLKKSPTSRNEKA